MSTPCSPRPGHSSCGRHPCSPPTLLCLLASTSLYLCSDPVSLSLSVCFLSLCVSLSCLPWILFTCSAQGQKLSEGQKLLRRTRDGTNVPSLFLYSVLTASLTFCSYQLPPPPPSFHPALKLNIMGPMLLGGRVVRSRKWGDRAQRGMETDPCHRPPRYVTELGLEPWPSPQCLL
jgi:hypothetical protein